VVGQRCSNHLLMGVGSSVVGVVSKGLNQPRADDATWRGSSKTYNSYENAVVVLAADHPDFPSYTGLDPSRADLVGLIQASIDMNCFPHKIAFDKIFYGTLRNFDIRASSFACKNYVSQKRFISELVAHLLHLGEDREVFELQSKSFVKRYIFEGVPLTESKICNTCTYPHSC